MHAHVVELGCVESNGMMDINGVDGVAVSILVNAR